MNDVLNCPICGNRLRNTKQPNKYLHSIGKTANYIERVCSDGINHVVIISTDESTRQVDLMTLSLDPKYTRFVEIDFHNQVSSIRCVKNGDYEVINLPTMLVPDFPALTALKEKVNLYIVMS